jgi:hypothetical protein
MAEKLKDGGGFDLLKTERSVCLQDDGSRRGSLFARQDHAANTENIERKLSRGKV